MEEKQGVMEMGRRMIWYPVRFDRQIISQTLIRELYMQHNGRKWKWIQNNPLLLMESPSLPTDY
jgi:hypothetical protein